MRPAWFIVTCRAPRSARARWRPPGRRPRGGRTRARARPARRARDPRTGCAAGRRHRVRPRARRPGWRAACPGRSSPRRSSSRAGSDGFGALTAEGRWPRRSSSVPVRRSIERPSSSGRATSSTTGAPMGWPEAPSSTPRVQRELAAELGGAPHHDHLHAAALRPGLHVGRRGLEARRGAERLRPDHRAHAPRGEPLRNMSRHVGRVLPGGQLRLEGRDADAVRARAAGT